ncbi:MAG: DUF3520 domain-containing protein [Saprospiraceae bacterium]|nr:DUF3520 domain-containing protein [Saprospiraceae bacterium]
MKQSMLVLLAALIFYSLTLSETQDRLVSGVVTDAVNGQVLVGVDIQVVGSQKSGVTNQKGHYELRLEPQEGVLIFSYAGYISKRIEVGNKKDLNVQLTQKSGENENVANESEVGDQILLHHTSVRKVRGSTTGVYHGIPTPYAPPGWNTEDYDFIEENNFVSTMDQATSTFSIDVDRASYSNMRRFILQGSAPPPDAIRIEEMINYFDYSYPQPLSDHPVVMYTEVGMCPWQPEHQLLHIGLQSEKLALENLPAANLVFLLDVSGSMYAENKLPLLISSFRLLVGELRPQDHVSIVTYAGSSAVVLEGKSGRYKTEIIGVLEELQAGGSTAGAGGILSAYAIAKKYFIEGGNNRVILATDGDFNVGVSSDGDLVRLIERERESGVFLSVLGFGMGNYKDNKMQKLADHGNGNHNYIDNLTEAKKVFVNEFGGSLFTVAKDVKIQIEFNPAKVAGYRLVGYENRKLENRDFTDDKKDAGELGMGHTMTALYEIIPAGIESHWLTVSDKRYTNTTTETEVSFGDELAYLKLRYKDPDGSASKLMSQPVKAIVDQKSQSENYKWASAVAGFGMLLRDSEFKQHATLENMLLLAQGSKGKDTFGYRTEFIHLMKVYQKIKDQLPSSEEASNK